MNNYRREQRTIGEILLIVLTVSLLLYPFSRAIAGAGEGQEIPTYTISPSYREINLNQTVRLTVSLTGGQQNTRYEFNVTVTKPDQTSTATAHYALITDGSGSGTGTVDYPLGFSHSNAAPTTDQVGTYGIGIDQYVPRIRNGVAASSFVVTSTLYLSVVSPAFGMTFQRGSDVNLGVFVRDFNGNPYTDANVSASLPGNQGAIGIPRGQQSGSFTISYRTRWSDPVGVWVIDYVATDLRGNRGQASVGVNLTATTLAVQQLKVLDASGLARSSFYSNDTLRFRVQAGYPDGSQVTSGAASLEVVNPAGKIVLTLAMVYDPQSNAYLTLTGFQLNQSVALGTWTAVVSTNVLGDGFGNEGPTSPATIQFYVSSSPNSFGNSGNGQNPSHEFGTTNFLSIALLGAVGAVPIAVLKRRKRSKKDGDIDLLISEASSAAFTLIEGEKQTGKSNSIYQIAAKTAQNGNASLILTFETPPTDVRARMLQLGINEGELEEKSSLQIIDCSNVSESLNLVFIRSQLLNAFNGKNQSTSVFIDSLDLLFTDMEGDEVQELLEGLRNEVKSRGGVIYATITSSSFTRTFLSNIENDSGLILQAERNPGGQAMSMTLRVMRVSEGSKLFVGRLLSVPEPSSQ